MKLTEDVEGVTLDGLRRFVEQAERSGAPGDTRVQMTQRRNREVTTLAVEFEPGGRHIFDAGIARGGRRLDDPHSRPVNTLSERGTSIEGTDQTVQVGDTAGAWVAGNTADQAIKVREEA